MAFLKGSGLGPGRLAIGRVFARVAMLALLLLLASTAWAQQATPELKIGMLETSAGATLRDIEKIPPETFQSVAAGPLQLRGDPDKIHWLRLDADLPALEGDARWVVWVNRARVDHLMLHWPAEDNATATVPLDFFMPQGSSSEHAAGYGFALPRGLTGHATFYMEVGGQGAFSVTTRLLRESEVAASDQVSTVLFTAVYTGLCLLLVIGLGMYIALRDRLYLFYLFYLGSLLVFLLAQNGHLYHVPLVRAWGHWRSLGLYAIANVLAAATVLVARRFAALPKLAPAIDRLLTLFPVVPGLLLLICVLDRSGSVWPVQVGTTVIALAAMLLAAIVTAMAWRFKRHLALPMLVMWLLLSATGCGRALAALGWVADNEWTQYAYQVMAALSGLLMCFALSDRIIEFRVQRDRAKLAKEQTDASLKVERERRRFLEALHTDLRDAPSGDQEWLAFRRLLEVVRTLVPQHTSAVALHGFNGHDLLLCEPHAARNDYQALLATRGGAFKGISRSQLPMQLRIDSPPGPDSQSPDLAQFAVLPLPLTAPAWGVLLVERRGWQSFEHDELAVAAELGQRATRAVIDAVSDRALRVNADFDALTGALNRRSIENRMDTCFKLAVLRRTPMAVLFVDLDHLKAINDTHGIPTGDRCVRVIADALEKHCGGSAMFGRYGGGTFIAMLPEFSNEQAKRWADDIRDELSDKELDFSFGKLRLSVSVGLAHRAPEDTELKHLIERADKALQGARRAMREAHGVVRVIKN
jgi:diguanylate cyclase (GGDEF)-like protein